MSEVQHDNCIDYENGFHNFSENMGHIPAILDTAQHVAVTHKEIPLTIATVNKAPIPVVFKGAIDAVVIGHALAKDATALTHYQDAHDQYSKGIFDALDQTCYVAEEVNDKIHDLGHHIGDSVHNAQNYINEMFASPSHENASPVFSDAWNDTFGSNTHSLHSQFFDNENQANQHENSSYSLADQSTQNSDTAQVFTDAWADTFGSNTHSLDDNHASFSFSDHADSASHSASFDSGSTSD